MINKFAFALSVTTICANIHPAYALPRSELIDTDLKSGIKVKRAIKPEKMLESKKNKLANRIAKRMARKNRIIERQNSRLSKKINKEKVMEGLKNRTANRINKSARHEERKLRRFARKNERFETLLKRRSLKRSAHSRWLVSPAKLEPISVIEPQKTSNPIPVSQVIQQQLVAEKPSVMATHVPTIESHQATLSPQPLSPVVILDPVQESPKNEVLTQIQDNLQVKNGLEGALLESPLDPAEQTAMTDEPRIQADINEIPVHPQLISVTETPLQPLGVIESLEEKLEDNHQIRIEENASLILEQAFSTVQKTQSDKGVIEEKEDSSVAQIAKITEEFFDTHIEKVKVALVSVENAVQQAHEVLQEAKSAVSENIAAVVSEEMMAEDLNQEPQPVVLEEVAQRTPDLEVQPEMEAALEEMVMEILDQEPQPVVLEEVAHTIPTLETQPEMEAALEEMVMEILDQEPQPVVLEEVAHTIPTLETQPEMEAALEEMVMENLDQEPQPVVLEAVAHTTPDLEVQLEIEAALEEMVMENLDQEPQPVVLEEAAQTTPTLETQPEMEAALEEMVMEILDQEPQPVVLEAVAHTTPDLEVQPEIEAALEEMVMENLDQEPQPVVLEEVAHTIPTLETQPEIEAVLEEMMTEDLNQEPQPVVLEEAAQTTRDLEVQPEIEAVLEEMVMANLDQEPQPVVLEAVDQTTPTLETQPEIEAVLEEMMTEDLNQEPQTVVLEEVAQTAPILETQPETLAVLEEAMTEPLNQEPVVLEEVAQTTPILEAPQEVIEENLIEENLPELDLVIEAVAAQELAKEQFARSFDRLERKIESTVEDLRNNFNEIKEESFNGHYPNYYAKDFRIPLEAQQERVENLLLISEALQEDFDSLELQLAINDGLEDDVLDLAIARIDTLKNDLCLATEKLIQLNSIIYALPLQSSLFISSTTTPIVVETPQVTEEVKPTITSSDRPYILLDSSQGTNPAEFASYQGTEKKDNTESTLSDSSMIRTHMIKIMGKEISYDLKDNVQGGNNGSSQTLTSSMNKTNTESTLSDSSVIRKQTLKIMGKEISYDLKAKSPDKDKVLLQYPATTVNTYTRGIQSSLSLPVEAEENTIPTIVLSTTYDYFGDLGSKVDLLLSMGDRLNSSEVEAETTQLIASSSYIRAGMEGNEYPSPKSTLQEELAQLKLSTQTYSPSTEEVVDTNVTTWISLAKGWVDLIINKLIIGKLKY